MRPFPAPFLRVCAGELVVVLDAVRRSSLALGADLDASPRCTCWGMGNALPIWWQQLAWVPLAPAVWCCDRVTGYIASGDVHA